VLIYLLFAGFTPLFAGTMGLALTAVLILGASIALNLPQGVVRVIVWVLLGLLAASFLRYGVWVLATLLVVLLLANAVVRGGPETLALARDALAEGAKNALPVGIACATVGVIIGTMTLTGVGATFAGYVVSIGEKSLFLSLVLTKVTCPILGMGIPTIPNYVITSSIAGPALLGLGVPLILTHMFVFYFGIMADLTPPVALAAFAAAPIARESGFKIGMEAMKIALVGFVVPYMAVYEPALMLQGGETYGGSFGFWLAVAYVVVKAVVSVGLWGAAAVGYLKVPLLWWERVLCTAAAFFLVVAVPWTDWVGFALAILAVALHYWRARQASPLPA
jgi:TRAP transporter 4TM/12TM fusion protein